MVNTRLFEAFEELDKTISLEEAYTTDDLNINTVMKGTDNELTTRWLAHMDDVVKNMGLTWADWKQTSYDRFAPTFKLAYTEPVQVLGLLIEPAEDDYKVFLKLYVPAGKTYRVFNQTGVNPGTVKVSLDWVFKRFGITATRNPGPLFTGSGPILSTIRKYTSEDMPKAAILNYLLGIAIRDNKEEADEDKFHGQISSYVEIKKHLSDKDMAWLKANADYINAIIPTKRVKLYKQEFPGEGFKERTQGGLAAYDMRVHLKPQAEWTENIPEVFSEIINAEGQPAWQLKHPRTINSTKLAILLMKEFGFHSKAGKDEDNDQVDPLDLDWED